ncbi:MAG: GTPase ObgE [Deltaproteobacteria bacterium]|nr:GTPase ObgE [Deltaproteobacteria bacterium]
MRFIDEVEVRVRSGHGGDGAVSFRREKYVPFGGPDGGDGGDGGSVRLCADEGMNTLAPLRGRRLFSARSGERGGPRQRTGRSAQDEVVRVPVGTLVRDAETGALLADLAAHGDEVVVARGGAGGRGNMAFRSPTHRAPRTFTKGRPAEERRLALELRLLAHVGVIGFPNAGKSTFVARVSAARPRIAGYPFTTLVPTLGVVDRPDGRTWVVADVPGLIEGAADGVGLGHRFLRHIQRCRVLLHLVSVLPDAGGEVDPLQRYRAVRRELERYDPALADRAEVVALSMVDTADPKVVEQALARLAGGTQSPVLRLSAVSGTGLCEVLEALDRRVCPPST